MKDIITECLTSGGKILQEHFGDVLDISTKGDQSNIVTQADLACEKCILNIIQKKFPKHNIVAEETGFQNNGSDFTWVIDPLDGTSNFVAGIPWFGILITVLKDKEPVIAVMYLPVSDTLYFSEKGKGVLCNNKSVRVTSETDLSNVLCSYSLDSSKDKEKTFKEVEFMRRLVNCTRNIRTTNSMVDFCYTVDGRLGACINCSTKIWDIAPLALMLPEAGGILTDSQGKGI